MVRTRSAAAIAWRIGAQADQPVAAPPAVVRSGAVQSAAALSAAARWRLCRLWRRLRQRLLLFNGWLQRLLSERVLVIDPVACASNE